MNEYPSFVERSAFNINIILIQLAQKNRTEQKIERLLLFQGPIQPKLVKIGLAFITSSLQIKHRLVFDRLFWTQKIFQPWYGVGSLELSAVVRQVLTEFRDPYIFEKHWSESLLNLKIFYLNHAVYKISQLLMMERDVKLDLIATVKEILKFSHGVTPLMRDPL